MTTTAVTHSAVTDTAVADDEAALDHDAPGDVDSADEVDSTGEVDAADEVDADTATPSAELDEVGEVGEAEAAEVATTEAVDDLAEADTPDEDAEAESEAEAETVAVDGEAGEADLDDEVESVDDEAVDPAADDSPPAEVDKAEADDVDVADDLDMPVSMSVGEGYWTVNGIALREVGGCLRGTVTLDARHGDGNRSASSGVVSRLLDEILAVAVAPLHISVATVRLEVEFLAPVPLDVPLAITTWVAHDQGRRVFCAATLQGAHGVVAQGHGTYLVVGDRKSKQAPEALVVSS